MGPVEHERRWRARDWGLVAILAIVLWGLVGLLDATWVWLMLSLKGYRPSWPEILANGFFYWLVAGLLTPVVAWIARRTSFEAERRRRAAIVHAIAAVAFACGVSLAANAYWWAFRAVERITVARFIALLPKTVASEITRGLLLYTVIVGTVWLMTTYRRYRERSRAAAALDAERTRLRASLSEARLEALQMQLQPHFLFNVLHAISTLIMEGETQAANRMLVQLSQFLRMTLDSRNKPLVPLVAELEFVDAYLRIQRERFGERLRVTLEIPDETLRAGVPNLILQPLIENAIRHGIASDSRASRIAIRARIAGASLRIEVEDDGAGLPDACPVTEGVGLGNVRARLEQLYPDSHAFAIGRGGAGGALVTLAIPFRPLEDERTEEPGDDPQ